ncbi:MAG: hypothetical protein N2748_02440, partial [candidate division WOR-3 bacterium]|nr:hypothetical protein [candidate division WOR-3 bacterium]
YLATDCNSWLLTSQAYQFREFSGILRTIPNGELSRFGNYYRDFIRAIVSVDFDYNFDVNNGFKVLQAIAMNGQKKMPNLPCAVLSKKLLKNKASRSRLTKSPYISVNNSWMLLTY